MHAKQFYPQKTQHWAPYMKLILAVTFAHFLNKLFFSKLKYYSARHNNRPKGRFLFEVGDKQLKVPRRSHPQGFPFHPVRPLRHIQTSLGITDPRLRTTEPSQLAGLLSSVVQLSTAQLQTMMWMASPGGAQCSSPGSHAGNTSKSSRPGKGDKW